MITEANAGSEIEGCIMLTVEFSSGSTVKEDRRRDASVPRPEGHDAISGRHAEVVFLAGDTDRAYSAGDKSKAVDKARQSR